MRTALFFSATLLLHGCALTDAQLKVAHRENADFKGPIETVAPLSFEVRPFQDQRNDRERIGWKKNGFGQNSAEITSERPVTDIVADAVRSGLQRNNHRIGAPADIVVTGDVKRFWFELDANYFTVEFIGNVECDIRFFEASSSTLIHQSRYSGTYSETTASGLEGTMARVMSIAVEKLVEDVIFDDELVEALASR